VAWKPTARESAGGAAITVALITALTAMTLVACPASASTQVANFLVPVVAWKSGFGDFIETDPGALAMRQAFGSPTSVNRDSKYYRSCTLRWKPIGVVADFTSYGSTPPNGCRYGTFRGARLTDRRWHTAQGIHPGSSRGEARRVAGRACNRHRCGRIQGFVFGFHRTDCAISRSPNVIAETRGRRVVSLIVLSRFCE
jgi:hypothetical protein